MRLAGGRAAVFHEDTLAFARTVPDDDPPARTFARFEEMATILTGALSSLGVDARIGEIPGEYCPGDYSVNARGEKKLIGIGQRLVRDAAHVGGVVVANSADRVRDVLVPVYRSLELEWDPETAGSVFEESGAETAAVHEAVRNAFEDRFELVETALDDQTLDLARRLEPEHTVAA
jgi:lipoate-protein ligase A